MAKSYGDAPDVERMCRDKVIPEWHPELADVKIRYLFVNKMNSRGQPVGAKVGIMSARESHLSGGYQACVTVNMEVWERWADREDKRLALLDHELCHLKVEETDAGPKLSMVHHDLEEFVKVIRRHGWWDTLAREFADQLELPLVSPTIGRLAEVP